MNNTPESGWTGSRHIGELLEKACKQQDWKDPYIVQNREWPLNPSELNSLYKRAVRNIVLTVSLGHRGKPPVEKYITLDADDFPQKLEEKLLADDREGKLDDIASMCIVADMLIDGEPHIMNFTHKLDDEDESAWYPPVPLKWNICRVCIDWCADRYSNCVERIFAKPGTEASNQYPNIVKDRPLFLRGLTGGDMFPDPVVIDYDIDGLTFQYGKCQYTVTPDERFHSDPSGRDYTTFWLTISLELI